MSFRSGCIVARRVAARRMRVNPEHTLIPTLTIASEASQCHLARKWLIVVSVRMQTLTPTSA